MAESLLSLKDIYSKLSSVEGQLHFLTTLAPVVSQNEKDIIRLFEKDKLHDERFKTTQVTLDALVKELKEDRKVNQKILIAIGVVAILSQLFLPVIIEKLSL